jgi:signal transduction histidine kinase
VKETLALISNQARVEKIDIQCHFPKDPVRVKGNFSLLQQVLINLFLNGIEAMRGGGTLSLAFEEKASEVAIHLTDTGRGISKKDLDKIFDPFYTTSPVGKGTGLGLSICYSIIKEHSGTIEMKSSEGKGSTFTIRLPVVYTEVKRDGRRRKDVSHCRR